MNTDKIQQILDIKKEKNAVILAHYYASDEVQAIADYVGDSFYLAKLAKSVTADRIVFCGVSFMGESAKILNPQKKVILPEASADCPMAHMADPKRIEALREQYPDLAVVCYINSTAELKCLSDVCVTSSNAVRIVEKLPSKNIFFIPDKNLGRYVAEQLPDKHIILNDGFCPIHARISREQLLKQKALHPGALVLSHPECEQEILEASDYIGSTAELIAFAKSSSAEEFIVATEQGVAFKLQNDNPGKRFYFTDPMPLCHGMKQVTLDSVLKALRDEQYEVKVDEEVSRKALIPLEKMLEYARS